jgi:hypothetical protein
MISQSSGSPVNVFTNDPNAKGLTLEQISLPPGKSPFQIPGWTGAGGLFNPGTPEFQAGELYVVLTRAYAAWTDFFGTDFGWQPGFSQLPIVPRAGQDFNAYYDRAGLKFFFNTDPKNSQTVYACESSDVVAHECGHAVLDAFHPEYWDSLLGETAAFHEAFGDMSAMLVTLADPAVRAEILAENGGDVAKSNSVSRLAEQLARGIYDSGQTDSVVSPDALRDAVNAFGYLAPDTLPGKAPASQLSSESHSFSRIFSGAFYDLLAKMYVQLRQENAALAPDTALSQARTDAGHLLAQGLTLAPHGDAPFKTIAASMITADAQSMGGKYARVLAQVFVGRRIMTQSEVNVLGSTGGAASTQTSTLLGTASAAIGTPTAIDPAGLQIGADLPLQVRQVAGTPRGEFRLVGQRTGREASRVLSFSSARRMQLTSPAMGPARGAFVDLPDSLAVHVDRNGRVLSTHRQKSDRGHEKRIRDHVAKLVARDRIYVPREGEKIDTMQMIALRQPYYIAYDQNGDKKIRRAFIACGALARSSQP